PLRLSVFLFLLKVECVLSSFQPTAAEDVVSLRHYGVTSLEFTGFSSHVQN
ncbi:MAG: hypothetical protein HZLCBSQH_001841, partial [Candidatus Fervidibacterota bacterium]